ncbi:MAG TPA: CDP-alcohol phosphatidyltransferase family protein [Polyangiaceae bacterium]|jgi:CDP-diacylglycerol--glycerol-3-phosphate 3-phosphatidyltransferase
MNPLPASEATPVVLAAFALALAVGSAYAIRVALVGRYVSSRLEGERGTLFLGRFAIEAFHWIARMIGRRMASIGISADFLSYLSLVLSLGAVPLCATGHWETAGALMALGACFDALDGIVAREQGEASNAGEMLDAFVDRYADAAPFVGLALYAAATPKLVLVTLIGMVGSQMVSYARAKAEALGITDLPGGIMRRPERLAYLCAALVFGRSLSRLIVPGWPVETVTWVLVGFVAVASNVAAFRLYGRARARLRNGR